MTCIHNKNYPCGACIAKEELTNDGKPHICHTFQVHNGIKEGLSICNNCGFAVDVSPTPEEAKKVFWGDTREMLMGKEKKCHVCNFPRNEKGNINCSAPHEATSTPPTWEEREREAFWEKCAEVIEDGHYGSVFCITRKGSDIMCDYWLSRIREAREDALKEDTIKTLTQLTIESRNEEHIRIAKKQLRSSAIDEAIEVVKGMRPMLYDKDATQHIRNVERYETLDDVLASLLQLRTKIYESTDSL